MTRVIAITGSAASGKSTVARWFADWGATLIDADHIVHELQRPGEAVHAAIVERFGAGVVGPDGTLDRPALRDLVLRDPVARADLEQLVHPAVAARRDTLLAAARERGDPVVVVEIPLLFEVGDPTRYDQVVVVDAPREERRHRLVEQRGLTVADAERLMAAQLPASEKRERADLVIDNDGTLERLERRARAAWDAVQP